MINWAEVLIGVAISAIVGLLLDELLLRGRARKAAIRGAKSLTSW